jgi:ABC-type Mn2+/Zn2+ transport system ATPase subunit
MNELATQRAINGDGRDSVLLTATDLTIGYGHRTILSRVTFEIRAGQFWFIIGPNGQGKTTLLRTILRRLAPQSGQLVAYGDFARFERVGFVPQDCSLNPTLPTTVREFVSLGLVGIRANRSERAQRLAEALNKVELGGKETHDYWSLSGGQQQRALVARALIRRPGILIADEPTSGLDLSVETALLQSLAELNRTEGLTVIMVMHDLAIAARFASHVALVHNGSVDAGPVHSVLCGDKLQRAYQVPVAVEQDASGSVAVRLGPSRARA